MSHAVRPAPTVVPPRPYPVRVRARLAPRLSRWLWLVKWMLVLPHVLVLALLWATYVVLSFVALVAILATGRYPRVVFDLNLGILRWSWRVAYYAYGALGTDEYPPFSLRAEPDYPATLDVAYPDRLSRRLVLVKWWLLALPHYLVVALFLGGVGVTVVRPVNSGLVGILVIVAGVLLLVRGVYPRPVFDFVLGMNRWALRVAAYAGLMTDVYPPFRLDSGGDEPGSLTVGEPVLEDRASTWSGGQVVAVVAGSLAVLLGLGATTLGAVGLGVDGWGRDDAGFVTAGAARLDSAAPAAVAQVSLLEPWQGVLSTSRQLGTVRVRFTTADPRPVFIGIAPAARVDDLLAGVAHLRLTSADSARWTSVAGAATAPPVRVSGAGAWAAGVSGTGNQQLLWRARPGRWALVVQHVDGSPGLAGTLHGAATVPHLAVVSTAVLAGGATLLLAGAVAVGLALRSVGRATRPATVV